MTHYGKSDIGQKRESNQDSFSIKSYGKDVLLAVVCDGMGGISGGSVASDIARDIFISNMAKLSEDLALQKKKSKRIILTEMETSVERANDFLYNFAGRDAELRGMGTTLVAALLSNNILYACNVGDSRLYRINNRGITQVTKDHSYVQYLVDTGKITEEEAKNNKNKNLIMRAVGNEKTIDVDTFALNIDNEQSEYFLLCSDGLTGLVDDDEIYTIVHGKETARASLKQKVECLVERANYLGGNDNITVILIKT